MDIQEENLKKLEKMLSSHKRKVKKRLRKGDYAGVITASRTYLEGVFHHIYFILLGDDIPRERQYNDLGDKFKLIKKLLSLDPNKYVDGRLKVICGSISSIINQIEEITNVAGDKHFPIIAPERYLAAFIARICITLGEFMYRRLQFLYTLYPQEKNHCNL